MACKFYNQRTKDLPIRICCMGDMIELAVCKGITPRLVHMVEMCRGFDYTMACNLLVTMYCFGDVVGLTENSGLFDCDAEHYRLAAYVLFGTVKKRENSLTD